MTARIALPLACALAALLGLGYAALVRPPHLFAYSDAVIAGTGTALLALAFALVMPDRWLHSEARLIRHAFARRHDVSEVRAAAALGAIQTLHAHAGRLARAERRLAPDLAGRAREVRAALAGVEAALLREPGLLPVYRAVIVRADTAIEAVEGQARLRGTRAEVARLDAGRARAHDALAALGAALAAAEDRRTAAIGARIDIAAATAETLMGGRPPRSHEGDPR